MNILDIMRDRHSVRKYKKVQIEPEKRQILDEFAEKLNKKYGTALQVVYDEPTAFDCLLARNFENADNYLIVGADNMQQAGFVGELFVLMAQSLGLNSCWAALTYSKSVVNKIAKIKSKTMLVIAIGYGQTNGVAHKNKPVEKLVQLTGEKPENFDNVVEAVMLAPTAINQQKFKLFCANGNYEVKKSGRGFYQNIDLGIVEAHLALATGKITL